ncbi:O-antigen ligase family protein [Flavobacterium koreense]
MFNIIKDISHFLKPITGLLIGYLFYKKIDNLKTFTKTIVLVGFISAIIHFIIVFGFSKTNTVAEIREYGKDNYLELFSFFFLSFYKKLTKDNLFDNKLNYRIVFWVLLLSCILYLSRTMMVLAILLLLSINGYTKITTKGLKVMGIFLLAIIGFYVFLHSIKIDRGKPGLEAFLFKVKIAPEEIFKTRIDRENHKELWDHWRGYEAKRAFDLMTEYPSSFVFGTGYGSLVNLKFEAPLTGENKGMKFISELHNGFAYVFYKTGIIGLIIYLSFLISLYKVIYKNSNYATAFISSIGILYFFTTLTITGIYNSRDIIVFILGALLFFKDKINSSTKPALSSH